MGPEITFEHESAAVIGYFLSGATPLEIQQVTGFSDLFIRIEIEYYLSMNTENKNTIL